MKILTICFALLLSALTAHAQVIVSYNFTDAVGNEASWNADSLNTTFVESSFITRGSGLIAESGAGSFNSFKFTISPSIDVIDYYSLVVTPASGVSLSLDSISFDEKRSLAGIRDWVLKSSVDGFSASLASFSVPDDTGIRTHSVNLSLGSISDTVEFRFFGFGADSSSGTWRLDNIVLNVVSEPKQYALVFAAGLIIFALIRRLRRI